MLAILSPKTSKRLEFVSQVIFKIILGLDFVILTDEKKYQEHKGFKLRYLPKSLILYEDDIHRQDENLLLEDKPALAFYLLTNYEEYLPDCPRDSHGRVDHDLSFVVRHSLYQRPVIHDIALQYKSILSKQQPDFQWTSRKYRFIPTFDVDIAYAYKGKNFFHAWGACCKALLQGQFQKALLNIKARYSSNFDDPFDTFSLHKQLCQEANVKPTYFILTASHSQYDRNVSPSSPCFRNLIENLQKYSFIGIHPSYYSENKNIIKNEIHQLSAISGSRITLSRQHFLRFKMSQTFENLQVAGITDDFSLGFYDRIGFRNGMALPFPFFNLKINKKTSLMLHPLIFMDSAMLNQKLDEKDYWRQVETIVQAVKAVDGELIANWHNYLMPKQSAELELFKKTFNKMLPNDESEKHTQIQ